MLAGMIAGATLVVAMLLLSRLRGGQPQEHRITVGWSVAGLAVAAAILATVLALSGGSGVDADGAGALFGGGSLSVADAGRVSNRLVSGASGTPAPMQVASVPSLLGGLERRLENDPADKQGWALLAQSYAFVGDAQKAEQALGRAVALGFDEAELRQRVASAVPDPHASLRGMAGTQP